MDDFIKVSSDKRGLTLHGRPFAVAGANCYYLMSRAADSKVCRDTIDALDAAAASGINVIRTWAFCDGQSQWNALQPQPNNIDEKIARALDFVIHEGKVRGLRLILCLNNYWKDYGGMLQYVKWSRQARGLPVNDGVKAEEFYQDSLCQTWFRDYLATIMGRVNVYTGIAYRNEPSILAFSICNEPQCHGDESATVISAWVHETAGYIKRHLDSDHLLCVDCEGFMGPSTADCCSTVNPYNCSYTGCDFFAESSSPHIDILMCHLYPDLWLPNATESKKTEFALRWLDAHIETAAALSKPLILSEFGKKGNDKDTARYYEAIYTRIEDGLRRHQPIAGSAYWLLAASTYPDYDGFTVYLEDSCPNPQTAMAIQKHASRLCKTYL